MKVIRTIAWFAFSVPDDVEPCQVYLNVGSAHLVRDGVKIGDLIEYETIESDDVEDVED